ncbi:MAG: class I SAM-dependent methyltransferase [Chloroflexota bacterium]|nr:class I SAM-dependent methyltransferase [Chloroflexota bacterium]
MASEFFDERAATWDDDASHSLRSRAAAEAIKAAVPLSLSTKLFEYGAGTAMVSQLLAADVSQIALAEPSAGMRAVIADKIAADVLPSDTRVWDLDLSTSAAPDERFDLVVTVMTLHHIRDLQPVLQAFASLLSEGGHLCIVDLESEDGSFHENDPDFHGHRGFSRSGLAARLKRAGFSAPQFQQIHSIEKDGVAYPVFLAVAKRLPE